MVCDYTHTNDTGREFSGVSLLTDNPFRVLGVFADASSREIIANKTRIARFASVGKTIEFDVDFPDLLPKPHRDEYSVEEAFSKICLPKDKVRYALFWFVQSSSLHEIAFGHLRNGNYEKAIEILKKDKTWEGYKNISAAAFLSGQYEDGIRAALHIIHDEAMRNCFVGTICGQEVLFSEDELAKQFLDDVMEFYKPYSLFRFLSGETDSIETDVLYVGSQFINAPIQQVERAITKAKQVPNDDAQASLKAGTELVSSTKEALKTLKEHIELAETHIERLIDRLANQILQCGINYFNNSSEYEAASRALELQAYAESIAIGRLTKERCKKNTDILKSIIKRLPPQSVMLEDKKLRTLVSQSKETKTISEATDLLRKCEPLLIQIKEKVGANNNYYRDVSTYIASIALDKVIDFINSAGRYVTSDVYKKGLKAVKDIEVLDTTEQFKRERLVRNKQILLDILSSRGIDTSSILPELDLRTDDELFRSSKSVEDYEHYLEKYPNGKHKDEATESLNVAKKKRRNSFIKTTSITVAVLSVLFLGIFYNVVVVDNQDFNHAEHSQAGYESYLSLHPTGRHHKEAISAIYGFINRDDLLAQDAFASKYPGTEQGDLARKRVDEIVDSLYNVALGKNTQSGWEQYKSEVPESYYQNTIWNKEPSAWFEASFENSIVSYTKYLKYYAHGAHASIAKKNEIDLTVDKVENQEHDPMLIPLKPLSFNRRNYGKTTEYEIENTSDYSLYAYFSSAKQSEELIVPAKQTKSITLANGSYRIAYVTYGTNAKPLFGHEYLDGEAQKSKFSVFTTYSRTKR